MKWIGKGFVFYGLAILYALGCELLKNELVEKKEATKGCELV